MHVDLRLPDPWEVVIASDGAVRATAASVPGIVIEVAPLTLMTDRKMSWAQTMLAERMGVPFSEVRLRIDEKSTTADGWAAWFALAERDDGAITPFAFYFFLDYASFALVRGDDPEPYLALLRQARPVYASDQVVALEQLWE